MPTAEALAAARKWLDDTCKSGGNCNCTACEQSLAEALDAFAQERVERQLMDQEQLERYWINRVEREKREAVEAVLRLLHPRFDVDIEWLADNLDRLAGRPVGEMLARVRGTDT